MYIPIITLEEMDAHKKGLTEVARNARQASRYLDELLNAAGEGCLKAGAKHKVVCSLFYAVAAIRMRARKPAGVFSLAGRLSKSMLRPCRRAMVSAIDSPKPLPVWPRAAKLSPKPV